MIIEIVSNMSEIHAVLTKRKLGRIYCGGYLKELADFYLMTKGVPVEYSYDKFHMDEDIYPWAKQMQMWINFFSKHPSQEIVIYRRGDMCFNYHLQWPPLKMLFPNNFPVIEKWFNEYSLPGLPGVFGAKSQWGYCYDRASVFDKFTQNIMPYAVVAGRSEEDMITTFDKVKMDETKSLWMADTED